MRISHRQLKAFVLVAHLKNFSRAAEKLYIAQSGLSHMIQDLEEKIGFRLLDRTTRQVSLTPYGLEFLRVAEQNVENLERAVKQVGSIARQDEEFLAVGAPPLSSSYILPKAIFTLKKQHANLHVELVDSSLLSISDLILKNRLDVGFGMFIKEAPNLVREPLFNFSLVLVSQSPSFKVEQQPIRWSDIPQHELISLPYSNPLQQTINETLLAQGQARTPKFEVNFLATQLGLAAAGCGVAIMPSTVAALSQTHKVKIQPLTDPIINLKYYSVRSRARTFKPLAIEFCDILKSIFTDTLPASVQKA
ncbi:MAG TPA: LysR family transcriptional regulator [Candidatus Sphingobacterium stercoripullorum]|nr:LysR family transcriptional regulator [Candidatus Sphingobacterium stercoripullorum]